MFQHIKCTSLLVVGFLIATVYVVKIVELLNVDFDSMSNFSHHNEYDHFVKSNTSAISKKNINRMDESANHLMWFIQISDMHISTFMDPTRVEHLREFCSKVVPTIQPSVVLASGDLTDSRTADTFGSNQFEEEWRLYKDVIVSSGVLKHTQWLDIRGNHDNFGVASLNSSNNYYRRYSVQGAEHSRSYLYQINKGSDKYAFIAVDACLDPGPKRPFNFYGLLTAKDMRALYEFEDVARKTSNVTIWFGHHPTSSILSPSPGIRHLMRNGVAYLCGHFHTLGGWIPHMYSLQKTGYLELELADWKDTRIYRLAAVDHGLFSFVDVNYSDFPVILVTNPKPALYLVPNRESPNLILDSTHVRVLVFSPSSIIQVSVRVNEGAWENCDHSEGPLYVLSWKPELYIKGLHEMTVLVKDSDGRLKTVSHSFSLDGSRLSFNFLARVFLMSSLNILSQVILGLSVCLTVLPICWARAMHFYVKSMVPQCDYVKYLNSSRDLNYLAGKVTRPRYGMNCTYAIMRKLWLVATIDRIFYPVVFMTLYVPLGPWFVGEIIDGHTGVCFAWGMFVNGSYLPGGHTFLFAIIRIWTFNIPLIWLLSRCLDTRYQNLNSTQTTSFGIYALRQILLILFFLFNTFLAYITIPTYGFVAFLINPLMTWFLFGAVVLWQMAVYTPDKCFRHLLPIFPIRQHSRVDESLTPLTHYESKEKK